MNKTTICLSKLSAFKDIYAKKRNLEKSKRQENDNK